MPERFARLDRHVRRPFKTTGERNVKKTAPAPLLCLGFFLQEGTQVLPKLRRILVAVAGDSVVKRHLKYFVLSAREVKRAVLLAGIKSAIGEYAAFCCHDGPPFTVRAQRYICDYAMSNQRWLPGAGALLINVGRSVTAARRSITCRMDVSDRIPPILTSDRPRRNCLNNLTGATYGRSRERIAGY